MYKIEKILRTAVQYHASDIFIASGVKPALRINGDIIKIEEHNPLSKKEAEAKAFTDFQDLTQSTQQSSRPDLISQQQASALGRFILAFQNTPMQYARLTKKAFLDLKNGRGDAKSNISKILYYGAAQNLIFGALQQALFRFMFDDDEEDLNDFVVDGSSQDFSYFPRRSGGDKQ